MSFISRKERILIVDDNRNTLEVIQRNLTISSYHVFTARSAASAIETLNEQEIDLVITDYKMPKTSGIELIRHVRDNFPDIGIIMITGYASIDRAVAAIKEGAGEYLPKPFTDSELLETVKKVIKKIHAKRRDYSKIPVHTWSRLGIIGESEKMLKVYSVIDKASASDVTVLITGESGTGKELVARAIHYGHKSRSVYPLIPVNCPAIPINLFESELFGHVKGAFTGAINSRAGFFHAASRGCIFLDEISELSPPVQAKLLRVLQEKEIYMVGKTKPEKVDVRIIAATNKDLDELVEKGLFREDLYFRLNIINIQVPPLRERGEDVILLANYFATKYSKDLNKEHPVFTERAVESLKNYYWPGNVRELENLIQRCIVMGEKTEIDSSDFPENMRFSIPSSKPLKMTLARMEKEYILKVLEQCGGNKTKAAATLDIDRTTLRNKIK